MSDTHVVTNQVPTLIDHNPATSPVLMEALIREGGQWGVDEVFELGALSGSAKAIRWGELADRNQPVLRTHDRYGHRVDEVEYDPAYHELMTVAVGHGLHAAPWADDRLGSHVVRAAKNSVWTVEPGHVCPISMTYAVVPALRSNAELAKTLRAAAHQPRIRSRTEDAHDESRDHRGHVDDGEAGWFRRPRRHHGGHAQRRRHLPPDRTQVVHLGADVRHLPGPGAGAGRPVVFLPAARPARRHAQPDVPAAPQGQARQPRQRQQRGRIRRRHGVAGRRRGPRRADHHRDGQPDPTGLHTGQCHQHARRA